MSNEIREKDHEWVKAFHSSFDRLLALLEKLLEKRQPSAYGDELLTQVGGKILYRASDIEKTLMKGYKEAYRYKRS